MSLLQMFTDSARHRLVGRTIGQVRWCRPVLSIAIGGRKGGCCLVVILESPGPFCFLSARDPLEGAPASARFPQLAGAAVTGVARVAGERVMRVDATAAGETGGAIELRVLLFGSAGRAELNRADGTPLHAVGARPHSRPGGAPGDVPAVPGGPFYLSSRGRVGRVAPSASDDPQAAHRFGPFDDAVAACAEVGAAMLAEARRRIVLDRLRPLARRLGSRRRLFAKLRGELERAEGHLEVRREAEILAAYQASIQQGVEAVRLPDIYAPDRTVEIALDPSVPVRVQVEKRFKLAAKMERRLEHTHRRIQEVGREVGSLERDLAAVEGATTFAEAMGELDRLERTHPWFVPDTAPQRTHKAGDGAAPFRRFDLGEGWFVLVGRNNRENDELTFHAAAPADLWFHAQQVAGSHVVLKTGGKAGAPPPHILEAAAAVAAFYSKSKHSGLAPVVYTQRKYVRKPRGARPGQVVCEREKTIVVAPGLPGGQP